MKNIQKLASSISAAVILGLSGTASANFFTDNQVSAGLQSSFSSSGLSMKAPLNETFKVQGVIGVSGTFSSYSARGLYDFTSFSDASVYGFGSVGLWQWSSRFFPDESVVGIGAGVGVEYDLRKSFPDLPAILVNAELGSALASFENYNDFDLINIGFGIHYQF